MLSGVSTRKYDPLLDEVTGGLGVSKSTVSQVFVKASQEKLNLLNSRDLSMYRWCAIMIDAIEFSGRSIVVAMGITTQGKKLILGLKEGHSESAAVCSDLLTSLIDRNLKHDEPFIFVLDGSKALRKAVRTHFDDKFPIQRCIRHKERNVTEYLPKVHHQEFRRRWKLVHGSTDFEVARGHLEQLKQWVGNINHEALASLEESGVETLTMIRLGAGKEIKKSLCSTNPLESVFDGVRYRTRRVKNWKSEKTQITRWVASSLLDVEQQLRCIRGKDQIETILTNIKKFYLPDSQQVA